MIFEVRTAPMHYVENVPAYKAGEWEGLKSCKFKGTRRMIRPLTEGIIFNDYEPPLQIKRNRLTGPVSVEKEFKPCIRIINNSVDQKQRIESLRPIKPDNQIKKPRPEKLHYFQYKDEYIQNIKNKEKNIDTNDKIKEELRLMTKIGFADKQLIPNYSLLKMQRIEDKKFMQTSAYWQKKETDRINAIREESEQIGRDKDYVKTLSQWDNKYLPKIK